MSFRFNPFTGRSSQSTPSKAYQPQGLQQDVKPPESFQFDTTKTKVAEVAVNRAPAAAAAAELGVIPAAAQYERIASLQADFMQKTHLFVWQKRGMADKSLYLATLALTVGCVGYCVKTMWTMAWPAAPAADD